MARRSFLIGMLLGVLIGVGATWFAVDAGRVTPQPAMPLGSPPSAFSVMPAADELPQGWSKQYFNGQRYYIVPLASG